MEDAVTDAAGALDERYGRTSKRGIDRRLGWVIGSLAVIGGLIFLFFGGWQTTSKVETHDLHYEVIDDRSVTLDFEVTSQPGAPVACAIEALSTSFATVGWEVVELPIAEQRTRRFTSTLVTTYPATTATLRSCWVVEADA